MGIYYTPYHFRSFIKNFKLFVDYFLASSWNLVDLHLRLSLLFWLQVDDDGFIDLNDLLRVTGSYGNPGKDFNIYDF